MAAITTPRALGIGALARRTGVKVETIRYYERAGLMHPPARAAGGHRRYDEADLRRLWFVRRGRELGFSLDDIRHLLAMVDDDDLTCREVHDTAAAHLAAVRRRIADLRRLERALVALTAQCARGETPDCPIVDALFDADPG